MKRLTQDNLVIRFCVANVIVSLCHFQEAVTCVKELPPANHANFCANALNHVLERSEVARRQTGHLLHDLVKNSIITVDSYIKG